MQGYFKHFFVFLIGGLCAVTLNLAVYGTRLKFAQEDFVRCVYDGNNRDECLQKHLLPKRDAKP